MTTITIKIEKDSPEIAETLAYLESLSGVTITAGSRKSRTKNGCAWDKALAAGAVSSKEFHARLENEIKNNW